MTDDRARSLDAYLAHLEAVRSSAPFAARLAAAVEARALADDLGVRVAADVVETLAEGDCYAPSDASLPTPPADADGPTPTEDPRP